MGEANLTDARLYDAHLLDVRINEGTTFDEEPPEDVHATRLTPAGVRPYVNHAAGTAAAFARQIDYELRRTPSTKPRREGLLSRLATLPVVRRLHDKLQPKYEAARRWWFWYHTDRDALDLPYDDLGKANTVYRTIQRLYRENSLPRRIDSYYVRARDTRRKQAIIDGDLPRWLYLAAQRQIMGYGERPLRVVGTSLAVVGLSALVYPLFGLRVGKAGLDASTINHPFADVGLLTGLGKSAYFSVITFTTLGYGDVQPMGHGEALATLESLVGAFLMALLVFVLGRRATR